MSPKTEWLVNLVQQVREEAGKVGLSQEEVVARLRAGETLEGLFPALAGACQGRTSAYTVWELQTHSWDNPTWFGQHVKIIGMTEGKSGYLHGLGIGGTGSGMGFRILPKKGTE
jgi:hypothetical protein